ncbi:Rossmann-like domain-containing protein [Actinokineospora guangxiensis]|uniref:Rossmann-like domain-containing protein n=1 Tax=Actinokineospora guangxiensis TaxID=1490288 RepID=A0ABW0EHB6_9PSEU
MQRSAVGAADAVADLVADVLAGARGPDPAGVAVTSVFWVHHGTRLAGGTTTYRNQYVLARVGGAFGACAFAEGEIDAAVCADASGGTVADLLGSPHRALRVAALDAYLAHAAPHRDSGAERLTLPAGTPEARARARDAAVAGLLDPAPGAKVALIGVVNPLVAAIRDRGAHCLPCDLSMRTTQWGDPVTSDMREVLAVADAVVATGMTVGNGTFDEILRTCRARRLPLVVYAQTGAAIARAFLGGGVTALSAEPFPFSQFSADETAIYRYRA